MRRALSVLFALAGVLVPSAALAQVSFESVTFSTSAVGLASATLRSNGRQMVYCSGKVEGAAIRYRFDGTAPTSSVGIPADVGDVITLEGAEYISNFKGIRSSSTDGTIQFSCSRDQVVNQTGSGGGATLEGDVTVDLTSTNAILADVETAVDGLETLVGTTNTSLTTIDGRVDGIEALLGTSNTNTGATLTSTNFAAAFGTAGTADSQVMSVQGIASGTALTVSGTNIDVQIGGSDTVAVSNAGLTELAAAINSNLVDVNIVSGAGSGGTALADDADFTAGTTSFTPTGGFYQSSVTACTDGDTCALGITAQRGLKVTLYSAAGAELTPSADKAEDAAHTSGDTGPVVLAIRDDTLDVRSGTENDYEPLHTNASGALWVAGNGTFTVSDGAGALNVIVDSSAALTVGDGSGAMNTIIDSGTVTTVSTVTTLSQLGGVALPIEDAAETAAGVGIYAMSVRRDTAAASATTAGDNATMNTDALGRLWTRPGNPCQDHARITTAAIDTTTSGNVQIVALNGSDLIYVCGVSVVSTAAQAFQLIYGTGTACATGETDLTGPYAFAANGGMVMPNTGSPQFVVPAGNAFCIETGGTGQTSGHVSYVRTATP